LRKYDKCLIFKAYGGWGVRRFREVEGILRVQRSMVQGSTAGIIAFRDVERVEGLPAGRQGLKRLRSEV
jgi:hypothetical protein